MKEKIKKYITESGKTDLSEVKRPKVKSTQGKKDGQRDEIQAAK